MWSSKTQIVHVFHFIPLHKIVVVGVSDGRGIIAVVDGDAIVGAVAVLVVVNTCCSYVTAVAGCYVASTFHF